MACIPISNAPISNAPISNAPISNAPISNAPISNVNYNFLNESSIDYTTFPTKEELQYIIHDHNINKILSLFREKIKLSNIQMKKKCLISEIFGSYELSLIESVRICLIRKGYVIQVIQDNYHNTTGWVVDWS